jgi:hypothetical protein
MKTQDLREKDLDSIWTPGAFWTPRGLHTQPQFHIFLGTELALTRAVEIAFSMFAHECGDNINISIYGYQGVGMPGQRDPSNPWGGLKFLLANRIPPNLCSISDHGIPES